MCFCSFLAREETILALTLGLCSSTSPGKGWVQKPQSPNWRMRGSQDFNQQLNIGAMRKLLDHFRSTIIPYFWMKAVARGEWKTVCLFFFYNRPRLKKTFHFFLFCEMTLSQFLLECFCWQQILLLKNVCWSHFTLSVHTHCSLFIFKKIRQTFKKIC